MRLSQEEQKQLVAKNLKLVYHLVNKLRVAPSDYDDIVSVGTMGLVKAVQTFDHSKGIKFSTYASKCIYNEIFMHFRNEKKNLNLISLDDIISIDKDGHELTLAESIMDSDRDFVEKIADMELIGKYITIILNLLKSKERLVILYRFAGKNQEAISKILNISRSYVSRLEEVAKNKFKQYLTNSEPYKEVYSMAIVGESYQIKFFSKDVPHFNKIFARFLQNLKSTENIPDFKVACNRERVIIQVPAHEESFSFIAQIIQEMDDYSVSFVSDKGTVPVADNTVQEEKTVERKKITALTPVAEQEQIISDNLSSSTEEEDKSSLTDTDSTAKRGSQLKQVREYILSRETFTVKEIKKQFPDVPVATINNAIVNLKSRGLITPVSRGEYAVKRD